jgi:hypothetical protein
MGESMEPGPGGPEATATAGAEERDATAGPARPAVTPGRGGLAQAISEEFSAQATLGGPRGLLEAVLPLTVFSVAYALTENVVGCVVAALIPAVVLSLWRILAREPITQAISGLFVLALGGYLAVRTGRAEDMFVPQLLKNIGFAVVLVISVLVRWPLIGVVLGLLRGEGDQWRSDPGRMRVYSWATWVWIGMFGLRLAIQVPLWMTGQVALLGLANIPLGLPLYVGVLWITWRLVRDPVPPPGPASEQPTAVEGASSA